MGKRLLTRKEQEEQRKREEEEAAAHAFKEFVETFQEAPNASTKVWVKAGTYDAGSRKEDHREKGKLYKPSSRLGDERSTSDKAQEYAKFLTAESKKEALSLKKKGTEKKKSNLELFKEELRQIQEEREERHKYKSMARQVIAQDPEVSSRSESEAGSFDNGDPNTTNLYLGNLSPKISEQQLMELFGRYGPLASIKIMWPRSEEEKSRGRNCGFVAYMSRKDAERALRNLNGRDVMGYEMRLGWGKSVPILNHPIYIPPTLLEYTLPPPPSGLPFNAQPPPNDVNNLPKGETYKDYCDEPEKREQMEKVLYKSVVKVAVPTEKALLALIHRMIEFVIREGPMFEALVMSREIDNPMFSFLFENESPAHIYYRWKLFSLLQGDTPTEWKEREFRMFKGGPIWKPPSVNFYTQGMPEELIVDADAPDANKGALSNAQRDRLEDLIRHLTPERCRIGDAMIFCIEHAEAADEICECISESLSSPDTLVSKKIARLYLISDILHNCTVKVSNASFFRKAVEKKLEEVFENLNAYFMSMESRLKAEGFKVRVMQVFRAWEDCAVYPKEFLNRLKNIFLGLPQIEKKPGPAAIVNIDGAPMSGDEKDDEDLDGIPLDGAALIKGALLRGIPEVAAVAAAASTTTPTRTTASTTIIKDNNNPLKSQESSRDMDYDDDIDGIPFDEDIDGIPLDKFPDNTKSITSAAITIAITPSSIAANCGGGIDNVNYNKKSSTGGGFIPSKWETVDPEQVEAQAITTSKWDTLDPVAPDPPKFYDSDGSTSSNDNQEQLRDANEDKRNKLREIELKTMQYQDELESGQRELRPGWSIPQQTEHYRKKLLKKKDSRQTGSESPHEKLHSSKRDTVAAVKRTPSPSESMNSRKSKRSKKSPSPYSSSGRSISPNQNRTSKSHRSRSPAPPPLLPLLYSSSSSSSKRSTLATTIARNSSISPPPQSSSASRSSRSSKRDRGKSSSDSPKQRFSRGGGDRLSPPASKPKYETSSPLRKQSSPSNERLRYNLSPINRSKKSPDKSGSRRDLSPHYRKSSPTRHRTDKHKHKHKY